MKALVVLCATVFGTCGLHAAVTTVDATLDSSVYSAFPDRAYGPGAGYIVQGSGFTDLINFNLSGIPKSAQVVPGTGMLLLHSVTMLNAGATGTTVLHGSSVNLNSGVTYNSLSGHEITLGLAMFTVDADGYYIALTGPGIDAAVSALVSGTIANIDLSYLGQPQGYIDGAGDPQFGESLSFTYIVPEPSTWTAVLVAFGVVCVWQLHRHRA